MLDKALQQPDGKISDKILYTEEEVERLTYLAMKERNYTPAIEWQEWWKSIKSIKYKATFSTCGVSES